MTSSPTGRETLAHWPVLTRPRLAGFQVSTEGFTTGNNSGLSEVDPQRTMCAGVSNCKVEREVWPRTMLDLHFTPTGASWLNRQYIDPV